jgi:AraC-like DNA-binding protein
MNKYLDEYRFDLINFLKNKYDLSGAIQSEISCLDFYFSTIPSEFSTNIMYEPSLCIILQGSKAVGFGNRMYGYNHQEYLLSSTHVPANVKITQASQIEPYMSLRIRFKIEDIYEVLKNTNPDKLLFQKKSEKGLFFDDLSVRLYEPISRLIKLLDKPNEDINYLSPFIIKEILYILVNGKSGYFLNKFAMEGTTSNKIVKAISEIKNNFNEKLNIKELADLIEMSESSLYQNFKTVTSLSPIQFQKKLRLEEAKQLLVVRNIEVSQVAYMVGYESPSQFSREFSRMFGMSPKAHTEFLRTQLNT